MKRHAALLAFSVFLALSLFFSTPPSVPAQEAGDEFRVLDIGERTYDDGPALAVVFSQALDPTRRYDEFLRVSDEKQMAKGAWVLSEDKRVLYFPFVEAETVYSVTVLEGLPSAEGKELGRRHFKAITTRSITPVVTFASDGLILPEKLSEGLPVAVVNVKTVEVEFFRMNERGLLEVVRWETPNSRLYYDEINEARQRGEFVFSGRYDLDPPKNKRVVRHIPVMDQPALTEPGVYLAVMREPGEYNYDYKTTYFIVTDIGLQARVYDRETLIVASSLATGQPLAEVSLSFYGEKATVVAEGRTDPDGVFRLKENALGKRISFIIARQAGHVNVLPFNMPALDLSEFELGYRVQRPREAFLYSPRDLYRPGETVTVSALLRDYDGRPVDPLPLTARLFRPDGRLARGFTWQPHDRESGGPNYYQTELDIPGGAQTGHWRLVVMDDPSARRPAGEFDFLVEDFMPERMKLELASPQEYIPGAGDFTVQMTGTYLYGAPAAGNRLEAEVRVRARRDIIDQPAGFQFGRADDARYSDSWELESAELDENGRV
ncbi:MAG: MG2 domain-containing protein, partial [Thermodesulfobacteriota bacterium]